MRKALPFSKWTFASLFLLASAHWALAQPLMVENFDYPAGTVLNTVGWLAHSGTAEAVNVVVPGLVFPGYPLSGIGGAAALDNNGEDVNRTFPAQSAGTVYAAFMVKVDGLNNGYFLHLGGDPVSTIFRAKVFLAGTAEPFNFGLSVGSNTATVMTGGSFSLAATYLFVLKYEIVEGEKNDIVSLYILNGSVPATEPATPSIGPLTDASQSDIVPGSIAMRQFNAAQIVTVDGIRIAKSWADAVTASLASDTTPPLFSGGFPGVTNISPTGAELQVSINEAGKVFYLVVPDGSAAPTAAEVAAGVNYGTVKITAAGTLEVTEPGSVKTAVLAGLTDKTTYDVYLVAQDDEPAPNRQAEPASLEFYTRQPPETLLSADFESSLAPFTAVNRTGDQEWVKATYNNNSYAYLNGYSGGNKENEDWLVSPPIDLDSAEQVAISFRTAKNYNGPALKVMMAVGNLPAYTVEGITGLTWTDITSAFSFSGGSFAWVSSGSYPFTANTGKVYVAFVYESTTSGAAAWEVDDFTVTGYRKTSSADRPDAGRISMYPNPAREELTIDHAAGVTRVEIFDMAGRRQLSVVTGGKIRLTIPVTPMRNGLYLIRFISPEGQEVMKFVKE